MTRDDIWMEGPEEMPNRSVQEHPTLRRAIHGANEHQEFEYVRHETVYLLTFLIVYPGQLEAQRPTANDAEQYVATLTRFQREHAQLRDRQDLKTL